MVARRKGDAGGLGAQAPTAPGVAGDFGAQFPNRPRRTSGSGRAFITGRRTDALFAIFVDSATASIALGGGCTQRLANPCLFALGCATVTGHGAITVQLPRAAWLRGCVIHVQGLAGIPGGPVAGVAGVTALRTVVLAD